MSYTLRLGPAVIRIEAAIPTRDGIDPFIAEFCIADTGQVADLTISVHQEKPPARDAGKLEAEVENSWRLYRVLDGWRLELLEQIQFKPRQVVFLRADWSAAVMYYIPVTYEIPGEPFDGWTVGEVLEPFVQWWFAGWLANDARGIVLHASAGIIDGQGFLFVGPSGAGKTTMIKRLKAEIGATILNDERIIVWRQGKDWWVGGTPWLGEGREVGSAQAPLALVAVLSKSPENRFLKEAPTLPILMTEAYVPFWDKNAIAGQLQAIVDLTSDVLSGVLQCRNDSSVAEFVKGLPGLHLNGSRHRFVQASSSLS